MMKRSLILDCDPGVDDAIALLLAFASADAIDLRAITTVAGNVGRDKTARNALVIRELAGRDDVPVYAGCDRPLVRAPIIADHFHGDSGLGDLAFAPPKGRVEEAHAAVFIADMMKASAPNSLTIAITGPMTNVALALRLAPEAIGAIAEIVIMGGARSEGGNVTASAEYNVFADPHAAAIVFACGAPMTVFGLDATHQIRTHPAIMTRAKAIMTPKGRALHTLLQFAEYAERTHAGHDGAPLHDPAPIAYLLAPHLFASRPCAIAVETESALTLGHTSVSFRDVAPDTKTRWVISADSAAVFDLVLERLARA
jgi:purine nucleosidase